MILGLLLPRVSVRVLLNTMTGELRVDEGRDYSAGDIVTKSRQTTGRKLKTRYSAPTSATENTATLRF